MKVLFGEILKLMKADLFQQFERRPHGKAGIDKDQKLFGLTLS